MFLTPHPLQITPFRLTDFSGHSQFLVKENQPFKFPIICFATFHEYVKYHMQECLSLSKIFLHPHQ